MLPQGIFSVAVATVLFPALARLAARADIDAFRETVSLGLRQIGFLLLPGERRRAPSWRSRSCGSCTSAERSRTIETTVVAGGARGLLPRPHLQRDDADAEPGVLQPPVAWIPTAVALGNLGPERGSRHRLLSSRRLGDPAGHLAREHRRHGGPARLVPATAGPAPGAPDRSTPIVRIALPRPSPRGPRTATWYGLDDRARPVARGPDRLGRVARRRSRPRVPRRGPYPRIQELDALLSPAAPLPAPSV